MCFTTKVNSIRYQLYAPGDTDTWLDSWPIISARLTTETEGLASATGSSTRTISGPDATGTFPLRSIVLYFVASSAIFISCSIRVRRLANYLFFPSEHNFGTYCMVGKL